MGERGRVESAPPAPTAASHALGMWGDGGVLAGRTQGLTARLRRTASGIPPPIQITELPEVSDDVVFQHLVAQHHIPDGALEAAAHFSQASVREGLLFLREIAAGRIGHVQRQCFLRHRRPVESLPLGLDVLSGNQEVLCRCMGVLLQDPIQQIRQDGHRAAPPFSGFS